MDRFTVFTIKRTVKVLDHMIFTTFKAVLWSFCLLKVYYKLNNQYVVTIH